MTIAAKIIREYTFQFTIAVNIKSKTENALRTAPFLVLSIMIHFN